MRQRHTHREDAMCKKACVIIWSATENGRFFTSSPFAIHRPSVHLRKDTAAADAEKRHCTSILSLPFHELGAREEEVQDELFRHIMTREIGVRLRNCVWLPI